MDTKDYTTKREKGQHLTFEDRVKIEIRRRDGWSTYKIAKEEIHCSYNCIKREIERGTVKLYNGKVARYKAKIGQMMYDENRKRCKRHIKIDVCQRFIEYVEQHFRDDGWSLDVCCGRALKDGEFTREEIVSAKTLYNYVDDGRMLIKNIDLPEKMGRKARKTHNRVNQKKFGDSIEKSPESVENREEFGHWEADSVLGAKGADEPVAVTLVERKTRLCIWLWVINHSADALMEALNQAFEPYRDKLTEVFKTITADNGSEFSRLSELKSNGIGVYFTHPFSSYEKGTNECHNRMLRRFSPKGRSMSALDCDTMCFFADAINTLPRKLLGYATPEELFEQELDKIYALH